MGEGGAPLFGISSAAIMIRIPPLIFSPRQAKEEYDQMHETAMRQLADLVSNRSADFDSRFDLVRAVSDLVTLCSSYNALL